MNSRDTPALETGVPVASVDPVTIRLPKALHPLASWAHRLDLDAILIAVLDATKTDQHPDYIGTIIRFLRQQDTSNFLRSWRDDLACAGELLRISDAGSVSPKISIDYPAMPALKRVSEQLTGGLLTELSTVSLVNPPVPDFQEIDGTWIAALRTWVFVQTVDSVFRGGIPNRYLIDVTQKLRLAVDKDRLWLKLFSRLHGPTGSFHGITRDLAVSCSQLLSDQIDPVTSPSHQSLLRTLRNLCTGKIPQSNEDSAAVGHGRFLAFLNSRAKPDNASILGSDFPPHTEIPSSTAFSETGEFQGRALNFDQPGADESVILQAPASELLTPPEQDQQARGILLSSAEDHQFLPFSWNRPSPAELVRLDQWLEESFDSDDIQRKWLASFALIAIQTANSMETVLSVELTDISSNDWAFDLKTGKLHRLRPQRYNGWTITPETAPWVEPITSSLTVGLAPAATAALMQLRADSPASTRLGHLWPKSIENNPAILFNQTCKQTDGLSRIRSGMLSQILEQHVFTQTGDPVLTELLASHPRTGLGGACAYSSYRGAQVDALLRRHSLSMDEPPSVSTQALWNAAGSQLSPMDAALRRACDESLQRVNSLAVDPENWVQHHNALTAYVVVVLLAATGARPVGSPFESPAHFDLSALALYVEDKVSSPLHQGRLVPIPDFVARLIKDCYLPHLARLAKLTFQIDPQLSHELENCSHGIDSECLPLFFLLTSEPTLRWLEVTETSLAALDIFSWPLPWNLMRHRLPTRLKMAGHDHEIINGMTGHGDQGTAPYGPFSMRVWQDDANQLRSPLQIALSALNFQMPALAQWNAATVRLAREASPQSCLRSDGQFGAAARQVRREKTRDSAIQQAESDISQFVAGRPIDSLNANEWETLSQKMLLNDDGRPRTLGTVRYETLQHWISEHWQTNGARPRIKRRYIPSLEEKSPFTSDAIGCKQRIAGALHALRRISVAVEPSRTARRESQALAILLLILESRVGDAAMVSDLLQGLHFRLVRFQERYHLEYSPGLDKFPDAPVKRYRISAEAAVLFARAKVGAHKLDIRQWHPSEPVRLICQPFNTTFNSFEACVAAILAQVCQANAIECPGLVAGYLNGEIVSVGLDHTDWVRIELGRAAIIKTACDANVQDSIGDSPFGDDDHDAQPEAFETPYAPSPGLSAGVIQEDPNVPPDLRRKQQLSFDFFEKIRDALRGVPAAYDPSKKKPTRKDLDAQLSRLVAEHTGQIGRSCILLGEWQRSLLSRKTSKGPLRIKSLKRYLNALSVCFQAIACDHDLIDCDEDGVTEFYRLVMEIRQLVRPRPESIAQPAKTGTETGGSEHGEIDRRYRTQALALQLLKDFHRFAHREFGVEHPDWSEIDAADASLSISPGMLTEAEYLCALESLAPLPAQASREQLARAFILLMAFRFGLRGDEATGMLRSDWVDHQAGAIVALVRSNHHRTLKSRAGQRQIPLLFILTPQERETLRCWLASFEGITTLNGVGPLFADQNSPKQLMDGKLLRDQVSAAIKEVTCNRNLSLHHARHAFVNRVAMLLMEGAGDLWRHSVPSDQASQERCTHVRRLLLNTDQVTRRSLWALARLTGHAHPTTTVRNYLHLLPDLASRHSNVPKIEKKPVSHDLKNVCIDLDNLPFRQDYLHRAPSTAGLEEHPPLTANQALRFLHLCRRNVDVERARMATRLSDGDARQLIEGANAVDLILARRPHINPHAGSGSNLLSHIPESRWAALIDLSRPVVWSKDCEQHNTIDGCELEVMVGSSRQILLWKPEHFMFFRKVVDAWQLDEQSYVIHSTKRKRSDLAAVAGLAGLRLAKAPEFGSSSAGRNVDRCNDGDFVQIDAVVLDRLAETVGHRCGVLAQTHPASKLRASHELVLILLISLTLQRRFQIQNNQYS